MKSILVLCGSKEGYNDHYYEMAYQLGSTLASRKIRIICGGAKVGLMGALATGAIENKGIIIGVIPHFLETKETVHEGLTQIITVNTMHERKLKMYEMSDVIITLPGGWGTMDQLFEILTWGQLGLHNKPVGLLNINGYYEALKALSGYMVQEGFLDEYFNNHLLISDSIEELLEMLANSEPPVNKQWISKQAT